MTAIEERLRVAGWRQGDVVVQIWTDHLLDLCIDRRPVPADGSTRLVLISQDCDIVADEQREPYLELVMGSLTAEIRPDLAQGKNPRRLHLPCLGAQLDISIHDRFRIIKEGFGEATRDADSSLDVSSRDCLRRWLGRRYLRSAFPDAFNLRLGASKTFARFGKSELAKKVSVILFETVEEELPSDKSYPLNVLVGISDDVSLTERAELEAKLTSSLSVPGIEVVDLRLATEDDISYRYLRRYRRLDLDFRSLPEDEGVTAPPEGIDAV